MTKILSGFLISWAIGVCIMPVIICCIKKLSVSQTILGYVEEHKSKQGTPTMGGVLFFLCTLVVALILLPFRMEWFIVYVVGLCFALLGFLDDFIKVKYKQNLGLRAYQKVIGQVGISFIFALYVYFSKVGSTIILPFSFGSIDIGIWIIPAIMFVCLATTNSLNLTDGLDGLASSNSLIFLAFLVVLLMMYKDNIYLAGADIDTVETIYHYGVLSSIFAGSIFAFLVYNTYRASIFMGDVGSLGIGGFISAVCCVSGFELFIIPLGITFIISAMSVIIQVLHFKRTGKRVFKMAPLHHHFQQCGYSEPKIVFCYSTLTSVLGLLTILFTLL